MKILFVGSLRAESRTSQRFRALKELGNDLTGISTVPVYGKRKNVTLEDRIRHRLGLPKDKTLINSEVIENIQNQRFDVLWIEKALMLKPNTLAKVKALIPKLKVISYTEDDMFAKHNQSYYYRKSIPYYDYIFTTKSYNCNANELPSLGAKRVIFVDKAYDKNFHRPVLVSNEERKRIGADVGFIGSFELERANIMLNLAEQGIKIRIWGNGWGKWTNKHKNLKVENKALLGEDYIKAICSTKINLCFLRKINRDLQTGRTMEIPACASFMLSERTSEHVRLFNEGEEAEFFDVENIKEIKEKILYYLKNSKVRKRIAAAGRKRCLDSAYSHHDRLKFMLKKIK